MTFLPEIMRSAQPSNNINSKESIILSIDDYKIDKRFKFSGSQISIDEIISVVPPLIDYKLYLDKVIKFIIDVQVDDIIQKDYLAKKICSKMTKIFYNSYNTINDTKYPINTYNELLYSQKEFDETLNIFVFLGMNTNDTEDLLKLQKEFKELNNKLNEFIIEKVNSVMPNDYDITTSFLPHKDEPRGVSIFDNYVNL